MLHNIHSSSLNPSSLSILGGENLGLPETGEFDFLNYLLGLQVTSTENSSEFDGLMPGLNPKSESDSKLGSDETLLELFQKKNSGDTSMLVGQPLVGVYQPQVNQMDVQLVGKQDTAEQLNPRTDNQLSLVRSSKGESQSRDTQNVLEDPIGQLAFNKAMNDQNWNSVDSKIASQDGKSVVSSDLKEKMIQSYAGSKKQTEAKLDSLELGNDKVTMSETQFKNEDTDAVDGPKRRTSRSEEFDLVSDSGAAKLQSTLDTVNPKMVGPQKVSQHMVPELFQKVESMVHHGGGKLTVTLTPPDLGQVEIHVSTKGKNVEVSVKSDNDFAKAAIESQVADLQQSLHNQDLNLSKIEVHVSREMDPSFLENQYAGFSGNGSLFQQSQSSRQDSSRNPWQASNPDGSFPRNRMTAASAVTSAASRVVSQGTGRVDIRI